ncbi:MAG: hypothetical protein ABIR19_09070, partial [Ginsengibacter sp.]
MNSSETNVAYADTPTEELEKWTTEYPYSAFAHYLLLCNYRKNAHKDFLPLAKKTALYFPNPLWLSFQLSNIHCNENAFASPVESGEQFKKHFAVNTDEIEASAFPMIDDSVAAGPDEADETIDYSADHEHLDAAHTDIPSSEEIYDSNEPEEKPVLPETMPTPTELIVSEISVSEDQDSPLNEVQANKPDIAEAVTPEMQHPDPQVTVQRDAVPLEEITREAEPLFFKNTDAPVESDSGQMKNILTESTKADDVIPFEPLHTVDYFASQGIRLNEATLSNDKLGTQMKSFTEWLKSMKKLHPDKLAGNNSLAEDIV